MKDEFVKNCKFLKQRVKELHDLTVATCEMCGGSYSENLNGATNYFMIDGELFKMTVEKCKEECK